MGMRPQPLRHCPHVQRPDAAAASHNRRPAAIMAMRCLQLCCPATQRAVAVHATGKDACISAGPACSMISIGIGRDHQSCVVVIGCAGWAQAVRRWHMPRTIATHLRRAAARKPLRRCRGEAIGVAAEASDAKGRCSTVVPERCGHDLWRAAVRGGIGESATGTGGMKGSTARP